MTDVVLIQDGSVKEIFPNTDKENLQRMFHPDILKDMYEVEKGTAKENDLFDGKSFSKPPEQPANTKLDYFSFRSRWTDDEKSLLHNARQTSWQLDDFIGLAQAQGYVDMDPSVSGEAKQALVSSNVLTKERADIIFALPEEN